MGFAAVRLVASTDAKSEQSQFRPPTFFFVPVVIRVALEAAILRAPGPRMVALPASCNSRQQYVGAFLAGPRACVAIVAVHQPMLIVIEICVSKASHRNV